VDPGEPLLRLLAQARAHAHVYAAEVARGGRARVEALVVTG
jgi:hypothetical protein